MVGYKYDNTKNYKNYYDITSGLVALALTYKNKKQKQTKTKSSTIAQTLWL
jgi:hypothetical protein